jgi:hypothetical protein
MSEPNEMERIRKQYGLPTSRRRSFLRHYFFSFWIVLVIVVALVVNLVPGFLVNSNDALRAVQNAGYTQPTIVAEHRFLASFAGCDTGDSAGFEVDAINAQNQHVKILVCIGWPLKGATIRFK